MTKLSGNIMLDRAVDCDRKGLIFQARYLYQQGMRALLSLVDEGQKLVPQAEMYARIEEYTLRTDKITQHIDKLITTSIPDGYIELPFGKTGCGYETIFGKYMSKNVIEAIIEEPNLYETYHFQNLIMLLEVLLLKCKSIRYIEVITRRQKGKHKEQDEHFEHIKHDLKTHNCLLGFRYNPELSDTRIIFSTGRIFRICHHGLHYLFEPEAGQCIGANSQRFRKSKETVINIFRAKQNFV